MYDFSHGHNALLGRLTEKQLAHAHTLLSNSPETHESPSFRMRRNAKVFSIPRCHCGQSAGIPELKFGLDGTLTLEQFFPSYPLRVVLVANLHPSCVF
jgi:hypothetical protein